MYSNELRPVKRRPVKRESTVLSSIYIEESNKNGRKITQTGKAHDEININICLMSSRRHLQILVMKRILFQKLSHEYETFFYLLISVT